MQVCGAFCSGYWALKMLRIFIFPLAPESHLCLAHLPQLTLCQRFCQLIGSKNATHFYR